MQTKPFVWRAALVAVFAGLATVAWAALADIDPYDQSGVPLEKQPTDPALNKIVLVAGHKSHGPREHEFFAGCAILMKLLQETPGVYPVMARDGWPKDPEATFKDAKAVVLYMDGGSGHPAIVPSHMEELKKLMDDKVGFVNLHYAVEFPKANADPILGWLGGYYETGYSINPTWTADFKSLPEHPITRGVKPFSIKDEWYFNIRFDPDQKGVTPILKATPPDSVRGTPDAKEHPGREESWRGPSTAPTAAGRSASRAATTTTTGATRISAGWWSTRSCGRPRSTCPRTAPRWTWTRPS